MSVVAALLTIVILQSVFIIIYVMKDDTHTEINRIEVNIDRHLLQRIFTQIKVESKIEVLDGNKDANAHD